MLDKKCIIILYSKGLYDKAAEAVKEELERNYSDIYVIDVDKESISPWHAATIKRKLYAFSERNAPFLNGINSAVKRLHAPFKIAKSKKEYKEHKKADSGFKKWLYELKSTYKRVHNVICRYEPDAVLCTAPELLRAANKAKSDLGLFHCSVTAIISDYMLDKRFVHHKTDAYFVANEGVKRELADYGIDSENIFVTGVPLTDEVMVDFDRAEAMHELGIDENGLNVLIMGGRYGSERIKNILPKFIDGAEDYNLIIDVGGSSSLSNFSEHIAKTKENVSNIYFIDAIDNIAKLYAIADVALVTPTSQITYELMYKKLPMILLKGSVYSDKANAHYLSNNGAALTGFNTGEAVASFLRILDDAPAKDDIISKQAELVRIDAKQAVADALYNFASVHYDNKLEVEKKRRQIMADSEAAQPHKPWVQDKKKRENIRTAEPDSRISDIEASDIEDASVSDELDSTENK